MLLGLPYALVIPIETGLLTTVCRGEVRERSKRSASKAGEKLQRQRK
jgi:hypothetical protein